jgi:hypothetical protein
MKLSDRFVFWLDRNYLPASVALWITVLALISILGLVFNTAQAAPAISITAVPAATTAPTSVTVTWTAQEVSSCTASGGWSGAKAATGGTEVVANVLGTSTFTLTCTGGTGTADLSWTPATQNVDGTPYTNQGGYKVYHSTTSGMVFGATPILVPPPANAITITGLPAGTRYFGVKTVNDAGAESSPSTTVSKLITVATVTADSTVTLFPRPKPPTLVTVAAIAYELQALPGGKFAFVAVGSVPLGANCLETLVGAYTSFVGATITKPLTGGIIAARCRAAT